MQLLICTVLGLSLSFYSGVAMIKGKTITSFLCINAALFLIVAAVGIAGKAT